MTVLLGRLLNGACWAVTVVVRGGTGAAPSASALQSAILVATL